MTTPPPGPPVVFAGPTLGGADVRRVVPGAVVLPPARCGDVLAALRLQPSAIVLIDGYYDTTPAPWHKELLWVLEAGIPVVGAASMGALRAAELDSFGMIGVGDVYASYRDGWRLADDEVAILHTPSPGDERAVTDALVDIEAKTDALVAGGLLDAGDAEAVATVARRCHFTERTMAGALDAAGQPPSVGERLLGWLAAQPSGGSRKRADAEAALRLAAGGLQRPRPHERLARTVHILRLAADASLRPFGQPDSRLPQAEQLLAADGALARAAAIAGGVLRVADSVPATPVDGVRAMDPETSATLAAAARIVEEDFRDHPAATAGARRLERLATRWARSPRAPTASPARADLTPVVRALAGPPASPQLVDLLAVAVDEVLTATEAPWRDAPPEPSDDGLAWADALLPAPVSVTDPVQVAGQRGFRRRAGQVMDAVRLGGALTGRFPAAADPFDAPLLSGLALLQAAERVR